MKTRVEGEGKGRDRGGRRRQTENGNLPLAEVRRESILGNGEFAGPLIASLPDYANAHRRVRARGRRTVRGRNKKIYTTFVRLRETGLGERSSLCARARACVRALSTARPRWYRAGGFGRRASRGFSRYYPFAWDFVRRRGSNSVLRFPRAFRSDVSPAFFF